MNKVLHQFPVTELCFPRFNEVDHMNNQYSVGVHWQEVLPGVARLIGEDIDKAQQSKWGLVNFRNKVRPLVFGMKDDQSDLVEFAMKCAAMGMSLDAALTRQPATVEVVCGPRDGGSGQWVALRAVQIDPSKIELPKWGEMREWER